MRKVKILLTGKQVLDLMDAIDDSMKSSKAKIKKSNIDAQDMKERYVERISKIRETFCRLTMNDFTEE